MGKIRVMHLRFGANKKSSKVKWGEEFCGVFFFCVCVCVFFGGGGGGGKGVTGEVLGCFCWGVFFGGCLGLVFYGGVENMLEGDEKNLLLHVYTCQNDRHANRYFVVKRV